MPSNMGWREAIQSVLKAAGGPLHYTEIADKVAETKLRVDLGATPANTVAAVIALSFKNEGPQSPFARAGRGYYTLRDANSSPAVEVVVATGDEPDSTGLVNAFGMFWERAKVIWEAQPKIYGQQDLGTTRVDFCEQRGVYLLHDMQGVTYVGRTTEGSLGKRLYQHTYDRLNSRWNRFSWFGVFPVEQDGKLKQGIDLSQVDINTVIITMEAVLIEGLEPRQNRKRGDEFKAIEFLQADDPELERKTKKALLAQVASQL